MENNKSNTLVILFLGIFVVILAIMAATRFSGQSQGPANLNQPGTQKQIKVASSEVKCIENSKYIAIGRQNFSKDKSILGTDILVKRKTGDAPIPCEYSAGESDFTVSTETPDYLHSLQGDLLMVDSGTGASHRELTVYDLAKGEKVFQDSYMRPLEVKNGAITYWKIIGEQATPDKCKNAENYVEGAMSIQSQISVELSTLRSVDTGVHRCSYVE